MEKMMCECSICLEPFEIPRGLPCLHNFCTKCLQWHIDNNREGEWFACPLCRELVTPPNKSKPSSTWASTFPIANTVCELMEVLHIKNDQNLSSSDHCEICHRQNIHNDPVALCKTCELDLCHNCSEMHSIKSPGHKIMLDKDSLDSSLQQEKDRIPICPTHKNSELDLFCVKCDVFICFKCTFGRHESCRRGDGIVKDIDVLANEKRSTDQIQVKKLQHGLEEMNSLLKNAETAKKNLLLSKKQNEDKIDQIVDDLIASLEKKRLKSKASVDQAFNTRRKCLEKTSFVAERRLKGLNKRISRLQTILEMENRFEYLSESKKITEAVNILLPLDFKSDLAFPVDPEFRLLSNKMDEIDIGNAVIVMDADYGKTPWCKFETVEKLAVKVYSGDITTTKVDGIVNPTDSRLTHSGELSQYISLGAGPAVSAVNKKVFKSYGGVDQLELSDVYITRAGDLNFQFLLHAVVPDQEQIKLIKMKGEKDFENLIARIVSNCLFVANSLRLQSVTLPPFCFSSKVAKSCAKGYLRGVLEFSKDYCADSTNTLREVHFVDTNLNATHYIQDKFQKCLYLIYSIAT